MHIEFLVEEPSAEAALKNILPKVLMTGTTFIIYPHQGKTHLLGALAGRLKGYKHWLPQDSYIVILVDLDNTRHCSDLKTKLENIASSAGLATKSKPNRKGNFTVINRIAIEELEAWFFGDVKALINAFPGVPKSLAQKVRYRNPDAIVGGTWEALERVLQRAGYYKNGYNKIEGASLISKYMNPKANTSHSFKVFRDTFGQL